MKYIIRMEQSRYQTTLSIYKDYKFNFLRRDLFDLISFANMAMYNKLSYDFKNNLKAS